MEESAIVGTIAGESEKIEGCSRCCITKDFKLYITNAGVDCHGHTGLVKFVFTMLCSI